MSKAKSFKKTIVVAAAAGMMITKIGRAHV